MNPNTRILTALTALTLAFALAGCSGEPAPEGTFGAGGGAASDESVVDGSEAGSETGALEQAAADGMPSIPITACPQLDDYEYEPSVDREFWHFTFTCADRSAFDESAAAVAAAGYEPDPLVISSEGFISERNYLTADANGGFTEVQLNLEGSGDELEFEVYVIITLP